MNTASSEPLYYDPYKEEIWQDPYPVFRRLRNEAPVYYNEEYDFYAVSRYDDVVKGMRDAKTFSSARGNVLEIIKSGFEFPRGIFIMEDPPSHTVHRNVLSMLFSPKNMSVLEPKIREFCKFCLDPFKPGDRFDFVGDLGGQVPMRVIGMLLGIPDADLQGVREMTDAKIRSEAGKPMDAATSFSDGEDFAEYIDWRMEHPSDDIMTQLLNTEIKDETGITRKLSRDEILGMVTLMAAAGNETTGRLLSWVGKTLAEHPDQRRDVADNPELIPDMIEEVLRFEPPGAHAARYVTRDVEIEGILIPEGSSVDFILASANRDETRFEDGDTFDIYRRKQTHVTFGTGIHTCIGMALARLETRIAVEEIFKRFKEWDVDYPSAVFSSTTSVRGWDSFPVVIR
ncbi:cytochrome P450 [Ketobacter sp. MCCC 1A13808]|uniref:cytochrome P450 n=1 Tax=Ketobacter sp. MCCC 1A13808 TaxID=2602738 RepID=UPI0012EBF3DC|nr:cytochrome P450 [Ketobacter sp. MCCC 1A13808]MVF14509.1 cytochrome P450 [Ketobacter sp. MCCC 1A13808]